MFQPMVFVTEVLGVPPSVVVSVRGVCILNTGGDRDRMRVL